MTGQEGVGPKLARNQHPQGYPRRSRVRGLALRLRFRSADALGRPVRLGVALAKEYGMSFSAIRSPAVAGPGCPGPIVGEPHQRFSTARAPRTTATRSFDTCPTPAPERSGLVTRPPTRDLKTVKKKLKRLPPLALPVDSLSILLGDWRR